MIGREDGATTAEDERDPAMKDLDWADYLAIGLIAIARDHPFKKARFMIAASLRSLTISPPQNAERYESDRALQAEHQADHIDAKRDQEWTEL